MASIGHALFGLAVARAHASATKTSSRAGWVAFPALALLPDLDVIAFAFGIPYAHEFGHRGASHALLVGVALGALLGAGVARVTRTRVVIGALCGSVAFVSHGLFDALTTGGEGIALAWPLDDARLFAPWRPIPVAPIGLGFLSVRGLYCAAVEIVLFAPFLAFAVAPMVRRRLRRAPPPERGGHS